MSQTNFYASKIFLGVFKQEILLSLTKFCWANNIFWVMLNREFVEANKFLLDEHFLTEKDIVDRINFDSTVLSSQYFLLLMILSIFYLWSKSSFIGTAFFFSDVCFLGFKNTKTKSLESETNDPKNFQNKWILSRLVVGFSSQRLRAGGFWPWTCLKVAD